MDYLQAILIAIVEGLTEYLPVSSTAHMIFTSSFFGIQEDDAITTILSCKNNKEFVYSIVSNVQSYYIST